MKEELFSSSIQLHKLDGGAEMADLKINADGYLTILSKSENVILEGNVKDFEYSNAGTGTNMGIKIYPRRFSFYKNGYEILFYDKAMDNPDNAESSEHANRKTKFLETLTQFGAYSGGFSQFLKLLVIGILGICILTFLLVYVFSQAAT